MSATLTVAAFMVSFGDAFAEANKAMVQARIDEAHRAYAGCASSPQYLDIVGHHAAHLLACSPGGHAMRLTKGGAETIYSTQRDALLRGIPVTGFVAL